MSRVYSKDWPGKILRHSNTYCDRHFINNVKFQLATITTIIFFLQRYQDRTRLSQG